MKQKMLLGGIETQARQKFPNAHTERKRIYFICSDIVHRAHQHFVYHPFEVDVIRHLIGRIR